MLAGQNIAVLIAASLLPPAWAASVVSSYNGFNLKGGGCWLEPMSARALGNLYTDDPMTVEKCLTYATGYAFAGIEYGRECWYGYALDSRALDWSFGGCTSVCNGDSNEICGGSNLLTLYQSSVPPTTQPATVGPFSFLGCWIDTVHFLNGAHESGNYMTLEICATFCSGYTYFGTEYGGECYCGNFNSTSNPTPQPSYECNMPCTGDPSEYCGSASRVSLYKQ